MVTRTVFMGGSLQQIHLPQQLFDTGPDVFPLVAERLQLLPDLLGIGQSRAGGIARGFHLRHGRVALGAQRGYQFNGAANPVFQDRQSVIVWDRGVCCHKYNYYAFSGAWVAGALAAWASCDCAALACTTNALNATESL